MKCSTCGKKVTEGSVICPKCGSPQTEGEQVITRLSLKRVTYVITNKRIVWSLDGREQQVLLMHIRDVMEVAGPVNKVVMLKTGGSWSQVLPCASKDDVYKLGKSIRNVLAQVF